MRKGELEADKDKMMREYRAQLDAERARKLAQGRNYSSSKSTRKKGNALNSFKVKIFYRNSNDILSYVFLQIRRKRIQENTAARSERYTQFSLLYKCYSCSS